MTNGGGPSHGRKQVKKTSRTKGAQQDRKASLKRKGWLPAVLSKGKSD
jgi:hypothetical protein